MPISLEESPLIGQVLEGSGKQTDIDLTVLRITSNPGREALLEEGKPYRSLGVERFDAICQRACVPCSHRCNPRNELRVGHDIADQGEELVGLIGQKPGDLMPQATAASRAWRAACRRAKSSPAWCEERVSGLAATIKNPLARAISE